MATTSVYWLKSENSEEFSSKKDVLCELDYAVEDFTSYEELLERVKIKRSTIIIITPQSNSEEEMKELQSIVTTPELQGARFIISYDKPSTQYFERAISEGVRDIISSHLNDNKWLRNFLFAVKGNSDSESKVYGSRIHVNDDIKITLPSRVSWWDGKKGVVEAKLRFKKGQRAHVSGALFESFGLPVANLEVEEAGQQNLIYRFSQYFKASLLDEVSPDAKAKTLEVLSTIKEEKRYKVFIASSSPALRTALLTYLPKQEFDTHTAMQKYSMVSEPQFFTPDIVFIESRLCEGDGMSKFQEICSHLPEHAIICVVGQADISAFTNFATGKKVIGLKNIPKNLTEVLRKETENFPKERTDETALHNIRIPGSHNFSYCRVHLFVKRLGVHEKELEFVVEEDLLPYSLIKVESTMFEKLYNFNIFAKIVSVEKTEDGLNKVLSLIHI